jgi:adenylate cyclase
MIKYLIPLVLIVTLALPLAYQTTPTEMIKLKTFDAFVPEKEASGYFTILNITDKDLEKYGYPLRREILAQINVALLQKGAIGLGMVMSFPIDSPFGKADDDALAESLSFAPSVIATFENNSSDYPRTTGTVIMGEGASGIPAYGVRQNIEAIREVASEGIAVSRPEVDSLIRRLPLLLKTPDGWVSAYGTEVLKTMVDADTYIIKTNEAGIEEVVVQGIPPVKTDYLGRKWISWVDTPQTTIEEMDVEGRFVFVGYSAKGVSPQLSTSKGYKYPHEIQAALAESILIQDSPYVPDYALAVELALFILSVAFVYVLLTVLGVTWGLVSFAGIFSLTAYYGFYTIQQGLLIDVTWTLISQFITGSTAFYLRFREQYKLRQQIKKQFEHYLDPRQVKELQKNPEKLKLGGEKRYATFLFTDVRGFTSLSESLEPEEVTYIMNKALTAQQSAVQKHGGMVDKYIGDAMMAIFNAPLDLEHHENKAIDCALDIQKNMEVLNDELVEKGIKPVAIGIGINTGYAVIGNMGSEQRFDYTAIGDAVNTGARLESGTKDAGVDLLIGYNTAIKSDYTLKKLEPIAAKGKKEPLQVYTWA